MNPLSIVAIAFAMSTDAFAAAIAKGAALQRPSWRGASHRCHFRHHRGDHARGRWLIGSAAAKYASAWDHWIAFTSGGSAPHDLGRLPLDERGRRAAAKPLVLGPGADRSRDEHRRLAVGVGLAFVEVHITGRRRHRPATFVMVTSASCSAASSAPSSASVRKSRRPASHRHRHRDRLRAPQRGS